ncbi:hypothetical protein GCM10010260_50980 [Streptomyces filipinensis]|uniref:Uncharacterized protein n=1 Tax=Streptomyces filipinensis TaxID=66887 RepID=A0A918IED6_9ACTN|nr:T-complex 10 C-terminal domain-containing protein [Streptomyces filipinensis]GGV07119.1 hypothetical protein GCM10010260_50980 [Streptomyces filipinensis]
MTVTNADGSTTVDNGDGTSTTTWSDGTTEVGYADGSTMRTFPDGRVLNTYPDGTRTSNDRYGTPLDPDTGNPLAAPPVTEQPVATCGEVESGVHVITGVLEASLVLANAEGALALVEPVNAMFAPISMALEIWHALDSAPRAYGTMGYCYGLMYGALDMGGPVYPQGPYSLDSPETVQEKQTRFAEGVRTAAGQLTDGASGSALRNRVLLRTAYLGSDPRRTLNEIWVTACRKNDDEFYADHLTLMWPDTGMTEA